MHNVTMNGSRDISSRNRRSILSRVSGAIILVFVFMPCVSAVAKPATWVYRTNFVDTWNSEGPCPLGNSIVITLATDAQAEVGFGDAPLIIGYKNYLLKSTARYILSLDDESLPAPFLIIDDEDRLEAWRTPFDKAPVCVYAREE